MARESKKSGAAAAHPRSRWGLLLGIAGLGVLSVSTGMAALKVRDYVVHSGNKRYHPQVMLHEDVVDHLIARWSAGCISGYDHRIELVDVLHH